MIEFILITAGISYGITKSSLFEKPRDYLKFKYLATGGKALWFLYHIIKCPLCMGFYVSVPVYFVVYSRVDLLMAGYMFIGSIMSYVIYLLIVKLEKW